MEELTYFSGEEHHLGFSFPASKGQGTSPDNSMTFTKGTMGTNKCHRIQFSTKQAGPRQLHFVLSPTCSRVGLEGTLSDAQGRSMSRGQIEGAQQSESSKGCRLRTRVPGSTQLLLTISLGQISQFL